VNQQPTTGIPGILYQPAKVATAAYALLDLASNNATDPDVAKWVVAARRALDHIDRQARDPASGLYHASLVTTGSSSDVLGDLATPADLLSSDVQATIALYSYRSLALVAGAQLDAGTSDPDVAIPLDATFIGPLAPMSDFPFESRASAIIKAMNALWDGPTGDNCSIDSGVWTGSGGAGYMDGLVPSTHATIQTKSTRPNAYMFAALRRQHILLGGAFSPEEPLINCLRLRLADQIPGQPITLPGANTAFIDVVIGQAGYFDTLTQGFQLEPTSAGPNVQSYTASAAAAVIAGFNEQLQGFAP
jgi:hypothetical protein